MSCEAGKLLELESRLSMVENHSKLASPANEVLRAHQAETLRRLRDIREELLARGGGGAAPAAEAEAEQLRADKAKLAKENAQLKYRVQILTRALQAEEAKAKS